LSSLQEAFFNKPLGSARRDHGDDESRRVFALERSCFRTFDRRRVRLKSGNDANYQALRLGGAGSIGIAILYPKLLHFFKSFGRSR
jgi:hypothetical protein